jgi:hypothetical protein
MNDLFKNSADLLILLTLGIVYLFSFAKMKTIFFSKYGTSKNNALTILYLSSLVASAVNLIHISEGASDAILFFLKGNDMPKAILYAVSFFAVSWLFSIVLFQFSFFIVSLLTKEDETDELIKNNTEIAWLHAIILVSLTFVIAPAIVKIAVSFIPYPELPF